jgi:hypothetical protein
MNTSLKKKIEYIKTELNKLTDAPVIAMFNDGFKQEVFIKNANKLTEFLRCCDGARCGEIDLWGYNELEDNQYRLEFLDVSKEKWLEFGQILYEPLLFNYDNSQVFLYSTQGDQPKLLGFFDEFMENYVFGNGYRYIVPGAETTRWFLFLQNIGLIL